MQPSHLSESSPIPTVDPADLRGVWQLVYTMNEHLARNPPGPDGRRAPWGIDPSLLAPHCSPGANLSAVWLRSAFLLLGVDLGLLTLSQTNARPSDAVFQAAAVYPIPRLDQLDVEAFLRHVANQ